MEFFILSKLIVCVMPVDLFRITNGDVFLLSL